MARHSKRARHKEARLAKQDPAMRGDPPTKSAKPSRPCSTRPDWDRGCMCCGATPIVPATGMCGPCTFGEAATIAGSW